MSSTLHVVIAGGGTGGHAFPALATAQVLPEVAGDGVHVTLLGTATGPEGAAAAAAGIPFRGMEVRGFRRSLSPEGARANLGAAAQSGAATLQAARLLRRLRADVAVGCGGYASVPLALAALATRTPLVLHEQNAVPGRANLLAARWARAVAVSFDASVARFRRPGQRVVVTGNPVRPGLAHLDRAALRAEAAKHFGLDAARRTLLVFGGSQGARRINEAALGAYDHWRDQERMQVLHLVGTRDLAVAEAGLAAQRRSGDGLLWITVGFSDRMDLAYSIADLAVSRAGAATVFELAAAGLPAVMVPYQYAGGHQIHNTEALVKSKAVSLLLDQQCTPAILAGAVDALLFDEERLGAMSQAVGSFARPEAAHDLARLVVDVAERER